MDRPISGISGKQVTVLGTGTPRRECLHVDDLADACLFLTNDFNGTELFNIDTGTDVTTREQLAELVAEATGDLAFETTKPGSSPRKVLDVSKIIQAGWRARIPLRDRIKSVDRWCLANTALWSSEKLPRKMDFEDLFKLNIKFSIS